jgi:hypothetical protein
MSVLLEQLEDQLAPSMSVPSELSCLFRWIESNGYYTDRKDGRAGFLFPLEELRNGWTDKERVGGTFIEFFAEGNRYLNHWLGNSDPLVLDRLCVFAKTGSEGSMAAFWLDDEGRQHIVHLGSGSGSLLCCILAERPIDFLRLLAIGYDEICWDEFFGFPPNSPGGGETMIVHPNTRYNEWLTTEFGVTIPQNASEIVKFPAHMGDTNSPDKFNRWSEENSG